MAEQQYSIVELPQNAREAQAELGALPWDDTRIVFTKRSLVDFLRTLDIYVDQNMTELKKLPAHATISRKDAPSAAPAPKKPLEEVVPAAKQTSVVVDASGEAFKPTRKVREAPGGGSKQIASLFGADIEDEEPAIAPDATPLKPSDREVKAGKAQDQTENNENDQLVNSFRPTRKVREVPGGASSMGNLLAGC